MKRLLVLLLAVLALLGAICAISGCEKEEQVKKPPVSQYKSSGNFTDLGEDQLSWEGLNALPMKHSDMTPQEARDAVIGFWRYVKTALWMVDEQYDIYEPQDDGSKIYKRSLEPGLVYAGLPYKGSSTGSIYRLFDFMDPETGVVDVSEAGREVLDFGGMCSSGCYWAWARVMNSANYRWCADSVYSRGYLRVGPYTYPDSWTRYIDVGIQGTDDVCKENGEQIMFQSYAAMQVGDGGITLYEKNGHTNMCSVAPTVVYNEDGTINGDESWLCIIEQGAIWQDGVSKGGIPYKYERSVERRFTFKQFYDGAYNPYTFGELIGTDPIEETEVSFSHTGETISQKQLFNARVTSNYNISDVYVYVYDEAGNEIYKHAVRARTPSTREQKVHKLANQSYTWGSWDSVKEGYAIKVEVQLGTGERPVVWEGKIAAG